MTVFSFHPVKIITTAEGGAALTNNKVIADKTVTRAHGVVNDNPSLKAEGVTKYGIINKQLSATIIGCLYPCGSWLEPAEKIDYFVSKRRELANIYYEELNDLRHLSCRGRAKVFQVIYLLFECQFNESVTQDIVYNKLHECGIKTNIHYITITDIHTMNIWVSKRLL